MTPEELHLRVFLVVLPRAIPVASGSTTSFITEGNSPNLGKFRTRITESHGMEVDIDGDFLISLKFWQFGAGLNQESQIMKALTTVAGEIHRLPNPGAPDYPVHETSITVVEMVTNSLERHESDDPFDRCMECLSEYSRALRVTEEHATPEIARQSLWPFAFTFLKDGKGTVMEEWQMMHLGHFNSPTDPPRDPMPFEQVQRVHGVLARLRLGDPWIVYAERKRDIEHSFFVNGNSNMTVVHAAVACEVLLMTALTMAMWESGTSPEDAASALSVREIMPIVSGPLAAIYGGNWDRNSNPAITAWRNEVAKKRNRIVHEGYRATEDEARLAFEASRALDTFVTDRMLRKVNKLPKTCLLAVGEPGLKRRGLWTRRIREFAEAHALPENDWLQSYTKWRSQVDAHLI
ncbi:hypothetical protein [Streptomyces virginiae]|uniref:hypothetical protein n=1 Tax=Streptomyces virginiae TaxID=1961 RepID=UPI00369F5397